MEEKFYYISEGRIEEETFQSIEPNRMHSFVKYVKNKIKRMAFENVKSRHNKGTLVLKGEIDIGENTTFDII